MTRLSMDVQTLEQARRNLIRAGLIAWSSPMYQVLPLDSVAVPQSVPQDRLPANQPVSVGQIFKNMMGGAS